MAASLENPLAKLWRAEEHLQALNAEASEFADRDAYQIVREPKTDEGWDVFRFKVHEEPPLRLGIIFGDWLQNLRAALDNLVTQLILLNGKPLPRRTSFPVFNSERSFKHVGASGSRGSVLSTPIIEGLQPYHGLDDPTRRAVEAIDTLAALDRHRTIHPTLAGIPPGPDPPFTLAREPLDTEFWVEAKPNYGPLEDNAEILRMRAAAAGPQPKVKSHGELLVEIAFGERGLRLSRLPVVRTQIGNMVELFAPDFPR